MRLWHCQSNKKTRWKFFRVSPPPPSPLRSISVSLCAGSRSSLDSLPVFLSLSVQSTTVSSSRHTPITFSLPTSFLFLVQVDTNYIFRVLLVSFLGSSISWIYCEYSWVPGDGFGSKLFSVLWPLCICRFTC